MPTTPQSTEPSSRWIRAFGSKAGLTDAVILLIVVGLAITTSALMDPLQVIADLTDRPDQWYLDEVVVLLVVINFGIAVFALRRIFELGREVVRRQEQEQRLAQLAQASSQWFWEMDPNLRFRLITAGASDAARALVRLIGDGASWDARIGHTDDEEAWARHRGDLARQKPFRDFRFQIADPDGESYHLALSGQPVHGPGGQFLGYRGTGRDVTKQVLAEREAQRLALHDPLTGLANRRLLRDRLDQAAALARNGGPAVTLLCIDLYRFREINDTLGQPAGDRLLQLCAERLAGCVDAADLVARLGDDEFAILRSGGGDPATLAEGLCCQILSSLTTPFELDGHEVTVTASIGIALAPDDGDQADNLLKSADIALLRARVEGPCSFCFFDPRAALELQERKALEHDLWRGFRRGEFELYYLPKVDPATDSVIALEALIRWQHPERGVLDTADFLAAAECSGLILALGEWALRTACTQAVGWPGVSVAVNLSRAQFRERDLVGLVKQVLDDTGLDPKRLELEIPDDALAAEPQTACLLLDQLRELGVQITLDDLGARYAALAFLRVAALGRIKLDRSAVAALGRSEDPRALVRAIVTLGRGLGVATCAEGVETAEQLTLLAEEGCVELQGFHFSRPLSTGEVTALLEGGIDRLREASPAA